MTLEAKAMQIAGLRVLLDTGILSIADTDAQPRTLAGAWQSPTATLAAGPACSAEMAAYLFPTEKLAELLGSSVDIWPRAIQAEIIQGGLEHILDTLGSPMDPARELEPA